MPPSSRNFLITQIFQTLCDPYDSAAILDRTGQVLHLKYETLADLGTLGPAAQTAMKYFPLKVGDLVVLNDPYSGGTVLSTIALVTALNESLILIARKGFRQQLTLANKLDEEGLRIPPTPLAQNYQIATPILEAISQHPQAPENFKKRFADFATQTLESSKKFQRVEKVSPHLLKPARLATYISDTKEKILEVLSELAHGETSADAELLSGELLRLKLELSNSGLKVSFSGTKPSQRMCLTDTATIGAVTGSLLAFLKIPVPVNEGLLSLIHVETPLGCFLNAKYPSPTFLGMTEGTSFLAQTLLRALKALSPKNEVAESASLPLMLNIDFGNGMHLFDSIPGGAGATSTADGSDAIHFWTRNRLEPSVEELESRFPVSVRQLGVRKDSGGKGAHRGGHGMVKEYELLKPAEVYYLRTQEKNSRRPVKGAIEGEASVITINQNRSDVQILSEAQGKISLPAGARITVESSGGGGYGKPGIS